MILQETSQRLLQCITIEKEGASIILNQIETFKEGGTNRSSYTQSIYACDCNYC